MSSEYSNIPGYRNILAEEFAKILNSVHDIAQELAYIDKVDLRGLDALNQSYVCLAFGLASERAKNELYDNPSIAFSIESRLISIKEVEGIGSKAITCIYVLINGKCISALKLY